MLARKVISIADTDEYGSVIDIAWFEDSTMILMRDITLPDSSEVHLPGSQLANNLTLDLNGHTFDLNGRMLDLSAGYYTEDGQTYLPGDFEIKSSQSGGVITSWYSPTLYLTTAAHVTIDGVTVENTYESPSGAGSYGGGTAIKVYSIESLEINNSTVVAVGPILYSGNDLQFADSISISNSTLLSAETALDFNHFFDAGIRRNFTVTVTGSTVQGGEYDLLYPQPAKISEGVTVSITIDGQSVTENIEGTAPKYTVVFNANHTDGGTTPITFSQTFTCGVKGKYLNPDSWNTGITTRTGYTFTGWNTKEDGSGDSYAEKEQIMSDLASVGESITLYAQWEADTTNGGEVSE